MKKLKITQPEAMIFQMLNRRWMKDTDVAKILHCQPNEAYDKVRKIASKHRLHSMLIEDGKKEAQMIVVKPSSKVTILKFVSILPP
jgi:HD-like signal output (HDOD) protein